MLSLGVSPKTTQSGFKIKNGSATLFDGSRILVSIPEERLTRVKSDYGCTKAVDYILHNVLNGEFPEKVAISTCCESFENASLDDLNEGLFLGNRLIKAESHHHSHALCAFYLSTFEKAIICVIDAGGNTLSHAPPDRWWNASREQVSIYLAEGHKLKLLRRCFDTPNAWGIGEAYRAFTKFLGFGGQTNSGKLMGLASYGEPITVNKSLFVLTPGGGLDSLLKMQSPWNAESAVEEFIKSAGIKLNRRLPTEPLHAIHSDIARFMQEETEKAILHVIRWAIHLTKVENVCIAGGVGLNCPINTRLLTENIAQNVFVPPCPGDDGQSVGNAILPFHLAAKDRFVVDFQNAFCGPDSSMDYEKLCHLVDQDINIQRTEDDETFNATADLLAKGKIVGWFQGRSELGPRALGHRSILSDPRRRDNRIRLSFLVKSRDPFRPYAASVIEEEASQWFDLPRQSPYMLFLARLHEHTEKIAPTLYHPDRTCRLQTVGSKDKAFYALITSFKKKTGLPFVLNTSFNTAGMPLVEEVSQALDVLRATDMDAAVIGKYLISKRRIARTPESTKQDHISFSDETSEVLRRINMVYPGTPIVRRNYFGLLREYCDWILLGRKSTTIRFSPDSIDLPFSSNIEVVARPGGEVVYGVKIKQITILPFGDLSQLNATRDGFRSVLELRDALTRFYSNIGNHHPVTIYDIEVMNGFEGIRGRSVCDI